MFKNTGGWSGALRPRYALALLLLVGAVLGVVFWGGFHAVLEATNTEAFCISCHQMRDTVYTEYSSSVHAKNASGVPATCPDCHVPKALGPKLLAKLDAASDLYHTVMGTIDTPEQFEAERLAMAKRVWARMAATDSRECRNCHAVHAFDVSKMKKPQEAERMSKGLAAGETCIACHKGIAHKLPDLSQGYQAMFKDLASASAQKKLSKGDAVLSFRTGALYLEAPTSAAAPDAATADAAGDGKLLAASRATVLEQRGDWLLLKIEGWQQQGAERVIYALKGQRILNAALGESLMSKASAGTAAEDPETGLVWAPVSLQAWAARADLTGDEAALWAYGAELYSSNCGSCHSLPPKDHALANQVTGNLNAMKRFISIDDEQYRFLLKYLQFNAKDTAGAHHV